MSVLKIYYPDETQTHSTTSLETSPQMILPFKRGYSPEPRGKENQDWILRRARSLFKNHQCPACSSSTVAALELRDGLFNRKDRLIPGTSTVVGFRCESCDSEWPA